MAEALRAGVSQLFTELSRRWLLSAATEKQLAMSATLLTSARLLDRAVTGSFRRVKPMHGAVAGILMLAVGAIWMVQGLKGGERRRRCGGYNGLY